MDKTVQPTNATTLAPVVEAALAAMTPEVAAATFIISAQEKFGSSVVSLATPADNLHFDATLNRLMNEATPIEDKEQSAVAWSEIQSRMHNAHDHNNLRTRPRDRFIDECPHPLMVEIFRAHVGGVKTAKEVATKAANEAFDTRMFDQMRAARWLYGWEQILVVLLNAIPNKNLRPAVRAYFFTNCTYPDLVAQLRKATGCAEPENPTPDGPASTGKPVEEKARKTARANADREARAAMKGKAGQSSEPKGKKAKKKK